MPSSKNCLLPLLAFSTLLGTISARIYADDEKSSSSPAGPWYVHEPIRAGYQNWDASETAALRMKQAGLNTLVYAWNDWREPANPKRGDYSIRVMEKPIAKFLPWAALAPKHGLHIVAEIDCWAGDEGKFFDKHRKYRRVVTSAGNSASAACPREPLYWDYIARSIELMAEVTPPISGAVIDTETYNAGSIYPGYGMMEYRCCYCDGCFADFARATNWTPDQAATRPEARYGQLLSSNRLSAYFTWQEDEMAAIGTNLADRIHAKHPNFALGVLNLFGPGDWFGLGLARGLSSSTMPALIFSEAEYTAGYCDRTEAQIAALRNRRIQFRYVGGLMLSVMEPDELAIHAAELCRRTGGYWLFCSNTLFNSPEQLARAKPPWNLKAGRITDYVNALGAVERSVSATGSTKASPQNCIELLDADPSAGLLKTEHGLIIESRDHGPVIREGFDSAGSATDWEGYYAAPVWDRTLGQGSPGSLLLENPAAGALKRPAHVSKEFHVSANGRYRIMASVRTENVLGRNGAILLVQRGRIGPRLLNTHDWQSYFGETTADQNGQIQLAFQMHYTQGRAWLDDLTISPLSERVWESRPWNLNGGQGRFRIASLVPKTMTLQLQLLRDKDERILIRNLRDRHDLSSVYDLHGELAVRLRLIIRSWDREALWIRQLGVE